MHIKSKMIKNKDVFAFNFINDAFIMIINLKCCNANNCWHFNIFERDKVYAQLSFA